jgi:hypothetical protein
MSTPEIDYNDEKALTALLVGRRIIETRHTKVRDRSWRGDLDAIQFVLDDGQVLEVQEADGGCACSNGCWSVENPETAPTSVITRVEVIDEKHDTYGESATLRMFVYIDQIKTELVRSEGGDNGYYGWGYNVVVKAPTAAVSS